MENDYTLIITNYNQNDELEKCINYWKNINTPPKYYIISDDGSDVVPKESDGIKVITQPHYYNVSQLRNRAVDICQTEKFVVIDPSLYPYKNTMEYMLKYSNPHKKTIPILIKVDTFIFPTIIVPAIQIELQPLDTVYAININVSYMTNYVYWNEIYTGWGAEDNDFNYRCRLSGIKFHLIALPFIHLNHPSNVKNLQDENNSKRNMNYLQLLTDKYFEKNITIIEKDKDGNRIIYP